MCGIIGLMSDTPVNQRVYDALHLLQHRGQDAAGIATLDGLQFHFFKGLGLVRDVFRTRNMRDLTGSIGIGHVRYPTQGNATSPDECQPFYVNAPFGIAFAHNGNLTNADDLRRELYDTDRRHLNTTSDSEVLLNVLASELSRATSEGRRLTKTAVFDAVRALHRRVRGSYACVAVIAGKGMLAFRDPCGIRPICWGSNKLENGFTEYMVSSESVTMIGLGFKTERDLKPGEAMWIDLEGNVSFSQCADESSLHPCAFEFVYFARPDSTIDGINVYAARLRLGEILADHVRKAVDLKDIDVVMPIPDSARPCAQQLAQVLGLPYREGFIKNRYMGRTFIMPGQTVRKKSVRQKLNAMPVEFEGKSVLLVRNRAHGPRGRRRQGLRGLVRPSRHVPERLRHRHADALRTALRRRQERRGGREDPRRRRRDLPARRGPQQGALRHEPVGRVLRLLVLRRPLRHGRHHTRIS